MRQLECHSDEYGQQAPQEQEQAEQRQPGQQQQQQQVEKHDAPPELQGMPAAAHEAAPTA